MQQPSQSDQGAGTSKPEPFRSFGCLQTTSVGSSAASDPAQHDRLATGGSQCLCNCGSLSEWSSLQLQEQHLLETSSRNAQDMVVVVLTKSDNAAATDTDDTAHEKQKAQLSSGGRSLQSAGARSLKAICLHSPKQLTQELCLRLLALLLVVLATLGLAYRLAKRDN